MKESKMVIFKILHGIVPGVIALALVIGICAVGLMILNNRTTQSASDPTAQPTEEPTQPPTNHPTEPPTDQPTEPPTEEPADPLQELKEKATAYMKLNVKNSEKYTLIKFTLDNDTNIYTAHFSYLIYGYPTQDRCYVKIRSDGTLISAEQYDEGTMDGMPITEEVLGVADYELFTINCLNKATTTVAEKCICYTTASGLYVQYEVFTDGNEFPVSYKVLLWQQPERPLDPNDQTHVPNVTVTIDTALSHMINYVSDVSRYTLYDFSFSPDGLYTAIFYHQICGVDTMDLCTVIMREDGSLYNCVVDNEFAFDNVTITEEMLQIAQDNLYGIYTLSKEEWTSKPTMIHWVDKKLMITFLVTAKDGSMLRSYDVQLNWNLTLPDDKMAVECVLRYLNLKGYDIEGLSSVLDISPGAAHYDVMVQINGIRYECEVYISDGTIRNVRSEKVK